MVTHPPSIVHALRAHAESDPARVCYTFLADGEREAASLTFGDLDLRARAIATVLRDNRAEGGCVLVAYAPGIDAIAAFLGCLYARAVAVPVPLLRPGKDRGRLASIAADCGARLGLTTAAARRTLEAQGVPGAAAGGLRWIPTDDVPLEAAGCWEIPDLEASTAFLQYTSGSTAAPKGVIVTHRNLIENERLIREVFEQTADSVVVSWLPPYHDMGLIGAMLQPLYVGARCVFMSPLAFLQRPARWLQAISRYRGTTSGGPDFAYDLCVRKVTEADKAALDLSCWTVAFNGAEPVRSQTLARFASAFASCGFRESAFQPCYGLAEATLLVTGARAGTPPVCTTVAADALTRHLVVPADETARGARTLVACGRVPACTHVAIVDPECLTPSPPGAIGEIWVRGPSVAAGYWSQPEETSRVFGARLAGGEGPFLRTGDLGFLSGGSLYVTGRLKDLIIVRGANHYPHDIELTVASCHPGLVAGGTAAFAVETSEGETLAIAQEVDVDRAGNLDDATRAILEAVSVAHDLRPSAVVLVEPGGVPRTTSGKIRRRACRELLAAGRLPIVREWREHAPAGEPRVPAPEPLPNAPGAARVERWLVEWLASRLGIATDAIDTAAPVTRLGVDSVSIAELASDLEREGFEVPLPVLFRGTSIAALAASIAASEQRCAPIAQDPDGAPASFPMSAGQRALWLIHQLSPSDAPHNIAVAARVRGAFDRPAFARAVRTIVTRHAALRSTFAAVDGELRQIVYGDPHVEWVEIDGTAWSDDAAREWLSAEAARPFDLERGPLPRIAIVTRAAGASYLLVATHHIAGDFWSLGILLEELRVVYAAEAGGRPATLPPVASDYAAEVEREADALAGDRGEALWQYWRQQLAGVQPLALPADRVRPAPDRAAGTELLRLGEALTRELRSLAAAGDTTLYVALLASLLALLGRYSRQEDVLVASLTAGRTSAASRSVFGYFVKPVLIRGDLRGRPTFRTLLERTRATVVDALDHQDYPFASIVERLEPIRDRIDTPLIRVMFTLLAAQGDGREALARLALGDPGARLDVGGLELDSIALESRVTELDLNIVAADTRDGAVVRLQYRTALWERATVRRMLHHWRTLLESVAAAPDLPLADICIAPVEERRAIRAWNETATAAEPRAAIHTLIEAQAARTPDAIAIVLADASVSLAELNARANQLARHLRSRGVGSGALVAVRLERSPELVIAILATLKAGAAYVPIDAHGPDLRADAVLADARPAALIARRSHLRGDAIGTLAAVAVDGDWNEIAREPVTNLPCATDGHDLAYVIYTSGSTGRPKGVMVPHDAVLNFCRAMDGILPSEPDDAWLSVTSPTFDISVLELLRPLTRGARVVIQPASRPRPRTELSLLYFASDADAQSSERYRLLLEGATFADTNGFAAIWMPERHFHQFGGIYPNPSVTAAAIATITTRVHIRAGSVVLPLHDPIRVVEEWSVVDNLSNGRVGLSVASGWHADDFVLAPDRYETRRETLSDAVAVVRKLWRGDTIVRRGGTQRDVTIRVRPSPVQPELPLWMTAAGKPDTFRQAGALGARVLTHLLGQTLDELAHKIAVYRDAWREHGHAPGGGHVTLMLHTFLAGDLAVVRRTVEAPFRAYLRESLDLMSSQARREGAAASAGAGEDADTLLERAFERYFSTSGLFGTPESVLEMVHRLQDAGVDEIACLIDFGIDTPSVLDGLQHLATLKRRVDEEAGVPDASETIDRQQVTHVQCTPSWARVFLAQAGARASLAGLRRLLVGGEALPQDLAAALRSIVGDRLLNMYGPTETTIWSSAGPVDDAADVTLGRPIANTQIHVMDAYGHLAPLGVPGEICICGSGVARGYLRQPAITAERFVPDPFAPQPGRRMYRTGDVGRMRADGRVEFIGRADHQLKIRGHRVELGEVEATVREHPLVADAVVIAERRGPDDVCLVACVVAAGPEPLPVVEVQAWLARRLPDPMVPSGFVTVGSLPLTPNGKIDRAALARVAAGAVDPARQVVAPRDVLEEVLLDLWAGVLRREDIGVTDNFFSAGGHSLLAAQVVARVRETLQLDVPLRWVFDAPTVAAFAQILVREQGDMARRRAETLALVARLSDQDAAAMLRETTATAVEPTAAGATS